MSSSRTAAAPERAPPRAAGGPDHRVEFRGRDGYARFQAEALIPQVFEMSSDRDGFHGRLTPRALGAVTLIDYDMAAATYSRTTGRTQRDGVDQLWLQLVRTGGLLAQSDDRAVGLGPGTAALCDFTFATEQVSRASTGVAVLIPRDMFGDLDVRALHGAAVGGPRFSLLQDHLERLIATAGDAAADGAARAGAGLVRVITACLNPSGASLEAARDVLAPAVLARARSYMAEHLGRVDLGVDEVAHAVGVSRATLYRLCAPSGGVGELLWALRLDAARRALSDPGRTDRIADVAASVGFSSQSHFARRFRERYGFAPSDLRPF